MFCRQINFKPGNNYVSLNSNFIQEIIITEITIKLNALLVECL